MSASPKEYRWALVVSIFLVAFGSLPDIAGYAAQTPDQRFIGTFYDQQDYAVHLAAMHAGEEGNWAYQIRFTSEPGTTTYLKTFYVALGHFSRWTGLGAAAIYQAARLLFGLLACLTIYRLLMRVFPSVNQRRLAFTLTLLGSGIGWFQILFGLVPSKIAPVDLWLIDAYPLFSINLFPHFSAVIAALVIAITAFLDHIDHPRWQNIAVIVVCAIFIQIVNPIYFSLADLAMAGEFIFLCWRERRVNIRLGLTLGLIAVFQIPLLLYSFILFTRDPVWVIYNRQAEMLSPAPIYYLLGFGLFWPFAVAGIVGFIRKENLRLGWAATWMIGAFGLAYLPVNYQCRFLLAITLPLAVLATPALLDFSHRLSARFRLSEYTGAVLITALASIGTLLLFGNVSIAMLYRPASQFEQTALFQAVDWLGKNGRPDDVVLAAEPTSLLVAIRTPLRLYSGHAIETPHYAEKSHAVEGFYRSEQPAGWLEAQGITWVISGPHEDGWQPPSLETTGLKIAYQNQLVTIYRNSHP